MPGPDVGTGAKLEIAGSTVFFANMTNIAWAGGDRAPVETTHLGSTVARTFVPPDLYDPGEFTVDIQLRPDQTPPYGSTANTVTFTAPVANGFMTGDSWAATGFVTHFEWGVPLEELMTASLNIKLSGSITITTGTT